jgi:hypothetical protein
MYFDEIGLIFDPLKAIKNNSNSTQKWDTLNNKEDNIYIPILKAFKKGLNRIHACNLRMATTSLTSPN